MSNCHLESIAHDFEERCAVTEILVEMLAELSLAQIQAVLHSARKAMVTGKNLILKTQQTVQYMSEFSQAKGIQLKSLFVKAHPCASRMPIDCKCLTSLCTAP